MLCGSVSVWSSDGFIAPDIEGDFKEACVGLGCVEFQRENMFVSLQINSQSLNLLLIWFMSLPLVPFLSLIELEFTLSWSLCR